MAEMFFSKILIKSLNLAENPYKIPKFGGKTNYIQKIGGDIISRNSTFSCMLRRGMVVLSAVNYGAVLKHFKENVDPNMGKQLKIFGKIVFLFYLAK